MQKQSHNIFLLVAVPVYSPDMQFGMSSLSRLEGMGIHIISPLAQNSSEVVSIAHIPDALADGLTEIASVELIVGQWGSGNEQSLPRTWKSLLHILNQLKLSGLAQEIQDYMDGEEKLARCIVLLTVGSD